MIRWKNQLVIFLTQALIYFLIIPPIFKGSDVQLNLSVNQRLLLILTTLLLSAGSYVINDIFDEKIDAVNRPGTNAVGNQLSRKSAYLIYAAIGFAGLLISIYLGLSVDRVSLILLYPICIGLLWTYSHSFKRTPLFGNVIVSLFCAFVPAIILIAEWPAFQAIIANETQHSQGFSGLILILIYILFAFMSTLIREIVKDVEDLKGDEALGCRTLPILWGIPKTKYVLFVLTFLLIIALTYFDLSLFKHSNYITFAWTTFLVLLPIGYVIFKIIRAQLPKDFGIISSILKGIMVSGLILLIVYRFDVL